MKLPYFACFCPLLFILPIHGTSAGNGEVGVAFPTDSLVIDGDLSDWPERIERYSISRSQSGEVVAKDGFSGSFSVAFNEEERSLYVGLRVNDDQYVPGNGRSGSEQAVDKAFFIFDAVHSRSGSGLATLELSSGAASLSVPFASRDPWHGALSMEDVEAAVQHTSGVTTYEWRIDLGRHIYAGKTIGFDMIVQDVDEDGTQKRLQWGPQGYKNLIAGRLGGIILAMQNEVMGDAQGRVGWEEATDVALPTHLRVISADRPGLWVDVRVDETGRFQTKLPQGRYFVESPWLTNQPFEMFGATSLARINPSKPASIVVDEGARSSSTEVLFKAAPAPEHLFNDQPVLPNYSRKNETRVDAFIEAYREHFGITGLSVALIHDGEVVYDKQFGVADTIAMTPAGPDTLFEMASISKSLFALTAMRLVERGELDLDRPLVEYLPFPQLENDERAAKMTARHVLSHQSGLPNWAWSNDPRGWRTGGPIELSFSPGDQFGYSGEAYGYLARVIEKITGTPIDKTIEEELLDPLALTNTFPSADDEQANRMALGHSHYFPTFFGIERDVWVAGSMYSNASDLAHIAAAFMSGEIVSEETRNQVLTPEVTVPEEFLEGSNGWEESYGLGFHIQNSPIGALAGHGGNNGDFQTRFGMIADRGMGYVVFANNNSGHRFIEEFERFLFVGRPHAGN